jgi:hypothetical protein
MKLNPPASSSDLEAAREIARRLHQRRRRADFDRNAGRRALDAPFAEPPDARPARPFALGARSTPAARSAAAPAAPSVAPPAAAAWSAPTPATDEPEPPSWDDAEAAEKAADDGHLAGALDDLADEGGEKGGEAIGEPEAGGPEPAALPSFDADEEPFEAPPAPELPGVEVEVDDAGVSPDEMVGEASAGAAEDEVFDEPLAGSALDAPPPETGEPAAALGSEEELFDEPPAPPPSWDDVVEGCRDIARASGAMIIDPAGQVFAARGEWPEPGPDAIAGRLVAMMERTLKDAPTRSVSAPVGGQHLTAWRVPLAEGLVTAAFIADTPLRSDVRSAIDAEILRGAGA